MPFLQFKGKTAVETYHYTVPHHTLAFDAASSVLEAGQTSSLDGNVIIEGDNLLALKALLPTHTGRIKCIYIDPPYNTGNEGWVYNDNLTQPQFKEWIGHVVGKEGEDACRHDKWCCMMYPRLMLLKELLSDDGAIFVSIDDNEVAHLRLLMNEVFGEDNFVATIIWQKMFSPKNSARLLSESHDYIIAYAKSVDKWIPNLIARTSKQDDRYKNPDDDARGVWTSSDLSARNYYSQGTYPIITPSGRVISGPAKGRYWSVSQANFEQLVKDNRVWFGQDGGNMPRLKRFLSEVKEGVVTETLWFHQEVGNTQEAKKEVVELLDDAGEVFITPKPTRLIKRILRLATDEDSLVLDSFAGSGTTGQAVLELNKEDGGDRKFVLVQQKYDSKDDERKKLNICHTITATAERVRRVIVGQGVPATGGAFTYACVSDAPLFGEYRDLGETPPPFEDLAKYIFYTETSRQWDPAGMDRATGKIGQSGGTSYYLLYTPDGEANAALDLKWLRGIAVADPNARLVVYCEKFWMHRDELKRWEEDAHKSVRTMIVPFQLK